MYWTPAQMLLLADVDEKFHKYCGNDAAWNFRQTLQKLSHGSVNALDSLYSHFTARQSSAMPCQTAFSVNACIIKSPVTCVFCPDSTWLVTFFIQGLRLVLQGFIVTMHKGACETRSQIPRPIGRGIWRTVRTSRSALWQQTRTDRSYSWW